MSYIPKLGVNFLTQVDEMTSQTDIGPTLRAELDRTVALGVRLVRVFFNEWQWSVRDGNSMTRWDTFMREADNRGLYVLPVLGSQDRSSLNYQPWRPPGTSSLTIANWQTFVGKFVSRYRPGGGLTLGRPVQAWQVWNEPNIASPFWGGMTPVPRDYALNVLNTARAKIRESDPNGRVLTAGMADHDRYLQCADWIGWVWDNGGRFDAACVHPYWQPWDTYLAAAETQARMRARGITRQVWVTEFGWSADDVNSMGVRYKDRYNGESDSGQAINVDQWCMHQNNHRDAPDYLGPSMFYAQTGLPSNTTSPDKDKFFGIDGGLYDGGGYERKSADKYRARAQAAPIYYALPAVT